MNGHMPTLLLVMLLIAPRGPQSTVGKANSQIVQVRDFWIDPISSLVWMGKDNGKDVSWKGAIKYCQKLDLAGYTDWRVPNMFELQGIYDKKAESPGLMGAAIYHNVSPSTWHVRGNLFLTGDEWSDSRPLNDRGKPSSYAYYFDFNEGRSNDDPTGWLYRYVGRRALCVRDPDAQAAKPSTTKN